MSYVDPVTGDRLTAGERVSWLIQRTIRRWAFLGVLQLVTAACWLVGTREPAVLTWWNLVASDFAIVMEFLVGVAVIGQTIRDALVTRGLAKSAVTQTALLERIEGLATELAAARAQLHEVHATTVGGATPRLRGADGRFVRVK